MNPKTSSRDQDRYSIHNPGLEAVRRVEEIASFKEIRENAYTTSCFVFICSDIINY